MFEQQSALAAQGSLSTLQRVAPQTPPLQPSEQQSSAFVQATPSATQMFVHCLRPDMPVTGSQRPLQQSVSAAQVTPEAWQAPAVGAAPPLPVAVPVPPDPAPLPGRPPVPDGPPSVPARPLWLTPPQAEANATQKRNVNERRSDELGRSMALPCRPRRRWLKPTGPVVARSQ